MCKSGFCEKMGMKKYNGYCLTCCIHMCPEIKVVRNYKTKERTVVERVLNTYDQYTWIQDKIIQDGVKQLKEYPLVYHIVMDILKAGSNRLW
jgi:hypothetical protein